MIKKLLGTDKPLQLVSGLLVTTGVLAAGILVARQLSSFLTDQFGMQRSPVSLFLVLLLLGLTVRTLVPLPHFFRPGIAFAMKRLLKLGIILMGIRLSLLAVARIGIVAVIIAALCVGFGMLLALWFGRLLGVGPRLSALIAAGTGICGVSAIVATSPVVGAREEETAYAISIITLFGLLATAGYPYLIELVFGFSVPQAGIFLGTAVHDTAQVTGAALIYDQLWKPAVVSNIAITTKLVRNTFLVAVIPLAGLMNKGNVGQGEVARTSTHFPLFVLGFIACAALRTGGDALAAGGLLNPELWQSSITMVAEAAKWLLAMAITAVGLNTDIRGLARLSFRPLAAGLCAAVGVAIISGLLVVLFSSAINAVL